MTKLYSLPAYKAARDKEGMPRDMATRFSNRVATEMAADGDLEPVPFQWNHDGADDLGDRRSRNECLELHAQANRWMADEKAREAAERVPTRPESCVMPVVRATEGYSRENPHPLVSDHGGQYGYSVGAKYEQISTKEIASRVRNEIKTGVKAKTLPKATYSVRSGHRSIRIEISELPHDFPVLNPERVRLEAAEPHVFHPDCHYPRFTPEAKALVEKVEGFASAYRYDRSDSMTDYFDTNFYLDVCIDYRDVNRSRAEILASVAESR